uniref:Rieske domain-containing protein n=1 Tax=Chromera velia CCMP2878 TaxID=1169474 RepID=A0A0G4HYG1_9ALVE|mmetsp:Transcript_49229/g.97029  ORF Transcript_49229/g.97029 Transcript_49229/m.97029 type:complete len:560 (-) Transcript_49229:130-1809(-)|eukprot:Cvel_9482.t1-p1 / transcript=Cvel_9482.t1 / gene=Cvel_9482 / organism=Chromera_velia_CCMP2878 / gene_product=Pheophorbide a oxygenase, chloroplastic, putative / transcript_product=Pheophorbide a oxygenase, chloroplastic, putative / location=Cvel_scaffold547:61203-67188(-) / protein_length=559 / sequence_SO=supercontig / SO=protein_coding / is_pseudo=false
MKHRTITVLFFLISFLRGETFLLSVRPRTLHGTLFSNLKKETADETLVETTPELPHTHRPFQWKRNWYPVAIETELDPNLPHQVTVLNEPYVVWRQPVSGEWLCFKDACPHRLAPLSEGRIDESGTLMCTYHGWEFASDGSCARIPQASEAVAATALKSPRACASPVPLRRHLGMLFIWPDATEEGHREADVTEIPTPPQLKEDPSLLSGDDTLNARYLAYNWDTLVENVMDPAHVPHAHHGIQGNRKRAGPLDMEVLRTDSTNITLSFALEGRETTPTVLSLRPPSLLFYSFDFSQFAGKAQKIAGIGRFLRRMMGKPVKTRHLSWEGLAKGGARGMLIAYLCPVRPGVSRLFSMFPNNFLDSPRPRWHDHVFNRNRVLDSDMVHLHFQERELRALTKDQEDASAATSRAFYMPTQSDLGVRLFRSWLGETGGGQVGWTRGGVPLVEDLGLNWRDRTKILNRWEQHTKDCSACRDALQRIRAGRRIAKVMSLLSGAMFLFFSPVVAATATWSMARVVALRWGQVFLLLLSAGCALLSSRLGKMEEWFLFKDYRHGIDS